MFKRNPYEAPGKEELLDRAEREAALKDREKSVVEAARRLLDSPDAVLFREALERLERVTFDYLADYPANEDPIKDAYQVRIAVNKIVVLRQLLNKLEDKAHGR